MKAAGVLALLIRLVGWDAFCVHYYRILYWWVSRSTPCTAMNFGYAPLPVAAPPEGSDGEPYQLELYRQVALQLGEDGLQGKRVLEISCGLGGGLNHLNQLFDIGYAAALDRSSIAAFHARRRFGLNVVTGDARRLPFADRSFDVIINVEASHIYFGDAFVSEMRRVLVPGGTVLMADLREVPSADCEPALRGAFGRAGLEVVQFRDATRNILAALKGDALRRERLLMMAPWPLRFLGRPWVGTQTSEDYLALRDGRMMFFILAARLPAEPTLRDSHLEDRSAHWVGAAGSTTPTSVDGFRHPIPSKGATRPSMRA
jgi:SAM-dependent methyltransferase